jgi:hypothetical protein
MSWFKNLFKFNTTTEDPVQSDIAVRAAEIKARIQEVRVRNGWVDNLPQNKNTQPKPTVAEKEPHVNNKQDDLNLLRAKLLGKNNESIHPKPN